MSNFRGRTATRIQTAAAQRSADARRCPSCGRGSALVRDDERRIKFCRWVEQGKCDYTQDRS